MSFAELSIALTENLTESERSYLAMHARYEANRQGDPRYWEPDVRDRETLRTRWNRIADAIYVDPRTQS